VPRKFQFLATVNKKETISVFVFKEEFPDSEFLEGRNLCIKYAKKKGIWLRHTHVCTRIFFPTLPVQIAQ